MRYCKTKDKRGQTLYWKILKGGKRKRVSKRVALASGVVTDCKISTRGRPKRSPKRASPPEIQFEDLPAEILTGMGLSPLSRFKMGQVSKKMKEVFPHEVIYLVMVKRRALVLKLVAFRRRRDAIEAFIAWGGYTPGMKDKKRLEIGHALMHFAGKEHLDTVSLRKVPLE